MFGSTLYVLQTLIGDSMVVRFPISRHCRRCSLRRQLYRCFLAWERRLAVIAFPFLCLLGSTGK